MLTRIVLSTAAVAAAAESPSLILLQHTVEMKVVKKATGIGSSAPLSEAGYQLVVSSNSDDDMAAFVARLASAEAREISDSGSLAGLVPYYSGTLGVQSLDSLKKELRAASWVGEGLGRRAPLNEAGYQSVAKTGDVPNMMAFSRRILDSNGKRSLDESMLAGLIPWFNGQKAVQSFDKLEGELLNATWTEPRVKVELMLAENEDKIPSEGHVSKEDPPEEDAVTKLAATPVATRVEMEGGGSVSPRAELEPDEREMGGGVDAGDGVSDGRDDKKNDMNTPPKTIDETGWVKDGPANKAEGKRKSWFSWLKR